MTQPWCHGNGKQWNPPPKFFCFRQRPESGAESDWMDGGRENRWVTSPIHPSTMHQSYPLQTEGGRRALRQKERENLPHLNIIMWSNLQIKPSWGTSNVGVPA
ncbi:unnamed protein product [Leuciscus chuanchicus]